MSSEKTTNLNLHKWVPMDPLQRAEFNDNFAKIDAHAAQVTQQLAQNAQKLKNVEINIEDYGAIDIATNPTFDSTTAIQQAINYAKTVNGKIKVPFGKTYLVRSLSIYEGITIEGYGATFKRPDSQPNGTVMLKTTASPYSSDFDSKPLIIKGLTFDGNRANQGAYVNYEQQQSMLIMLNADKTKKGRLRAIISDCVFKESVSDGLHIWYNVDAEISNCFAENCFRGGLVASGGYSKVKVTNFKSGGIVHNSGVDLEIDAHGYGNTFKTDISMTNVELDGNFDLGLRDGAYGYFTNVSCENSPFSLRTENSHAKFINCKFAIGTKSASHHIYFPYDVTFINTEFVANKDDSVLDNISFYTLGVYMRTSYASYSNQRLKFDNCTFNVNGKDEGDFFGAIEMLYQDNKGNNNVITFNDTVISKDYNLFVGNNSGGNIEINNIECNAKEFIQFKNPYDRTKFSLSGLITGLFSNYMRFNVIINAEDEFYHNQVTFDESQNVFTVATGANSTNAKVKGSRIIYGNAEPVNKGGFIGDIYRLNKPIAGQAYEWIAINNSHNNATWKVSKVLGV